MKRSPQDRFWMGHCVKRIHRQDAVKRADREDALAGVAVNRVHAKIASQVFLQRDGQHSGISVEMDEFARTGNFGRKSIAEEIPGAAAKIENSRPRWYGRNGKRPKFI